jgi:hypothetical protein
MNSGSKLGAGGCRVIQSLRKAGIYPAFDPTAFFHLLKWRSEVQGVLARFEAIAYHGEG